MKKNSNDKLLHACSYENVQKLVMLESEVKQISYCLTYLANQATTISLNSAGLVDQSSDDVSHILNDITSSAKRLSIDVVSVRSAIEAAQEILASHLHALASELED